MRQCAWRAAGACLGLAMGLPAWAGTAGQPALQKMVTQQASFAVYAPQGWRASESETQTVRTLFVSDPQGRFGVTFSYGASAGGDAVAVAKQLVTGFRQQFRDLRVSGVQGVADRSRLVFDAAYTNAQQQVVEFRGYVTSRAGAFTYSCIAGPRGEQDWVSAAEGGAVVRSDSWGTWNQATGDQVSAADYYHFRGEQAGLQPIDSRELWEQHIQGRW